MTFAKCREPHTGHSINPVCGSISFIGFFIVEDEWAVFGRGLAWHFLSTIGIKPWDRRGSVFGGDSRRMIVPVRACCCPPRQAVSAPRLEKVNTIVGVLGKLLGDVEMPMLSNVTIRHG